MKRIWLALCRAADRREPATVFALVRLSFGLVLAWTLWLPWRAGALSALWAGPDHGGLLPLRESHWVHALLPDHPPTALSWLFWLNATFAVLSSLGLGGRLTLLLTQQCFVALTSLNPAVQGGYDSLLAMGLLLLACADSTRTLSLDCWLRHGRLFDHTPTWAWPRYALLLQLLCMYGFTGLQKLGLSWTPFGGYSALYYVLNDPTWMRGDYGDLRAAAAPLSVFTALAVHFEQLAPLLLLHYYYRATREYPGKLRAWFLRHDARVAFTLVGVGMHVGILLLVDVGPFSLVTLAYYPCLWAPAELSLGWQALCGRLGRIVAQATGHARAS